MALTDRQEQTTPGGFTTTVIAAIAGAIIAWGVGFSFCTVLAKLGLALVGPSAATSDRESLARYGLNYLAVHHAAIVGSTPSGVSVNILWPITTWAAAPAIALMVGGFVVRRVSGRQGFIAGAAMAVPYTILLLAAQHWSRVASASVALPRLPIEGTEFDLGLVAVVLKASVPGLVCYGLLFGIVFGAIGASGGLLGLWRRITGRVIGWPDWVRGACGALIVEYLVFLAFGAIVLTSIIPKHGAAAAREPSRKEYASLLPTAAAWMNCLAHGITLKGQLESQTSVEGIPPTVQDYGAGLISGILSEGKRTSPPWQLYLAIIVPVAALTWAGRMASGGTLGLAAKAAFAARMSVFYALAMCASTLCFTLRIATSFAAAGSSVKLGPSPAQSFVLSLVIAFIFAFVGAVTRRSHAGQ